MTSLIPPIKQYNLHLYSRIEQQLNDLFPCFILLPVKLSEALFSTLVAALPATCFVFLYVLSTLYFYLDVHGSNLHLLKDAIC